MFFTTWSAPFVRSSPMPLVPTGHFTIPVLRASQRACAPANFGSAPARFDVTVSHVYELLIKYVSLLL